jgi:hypothetical protein
MGDERWGQSAAAAAAAAADDLDLSIGALISPLDCLTTLYSSTYSHYDLFIQLVEEVPPIPQSPAALFQPSASATTAAAAAQQQQQGQQQQEREREQHTVVYGGFDVSGRSPLLPLSNEKK